jgi:hypothetical protein
MTTVYVLWDRRKKIKWIVMVAFAIETTITTVFSILAAQQMQRERTTYSCPF